LEVLFYFFPTVDEDDLFFLFFDKSATVCRTRKTILCAGVVGTMPVSVVAGAIFFFFFLGGLLHEQIC